MDSGCSQVARCVMCSLVLMLFLLGPAPALAHKLNVFAVAKGAAIEGRAYFPGDVPARKIDVVVHDPSGGELGRTTTDDDGNFRFTARKRVDHYLVAETPDGHSGQHIVHAEELPDNLPADVPTAGGSQVIAPAPDHADAPAVLAGGGDDPRGQLTELSRQIDALRRQIDALRRQIDASDKQLRFRDVLGGIGFILGLAGVALYMQARRRRT